jgi:hypothetical protein
MSKIVKCNNPHCSVSLFNTSVCTGKKCDCPVCHSQDIQVVTYNEGIDEFRCGNPNCSEYQINPLLDQNSVFTCPFCRTTRIDIKKHDIV